MAKEKQQFFYKFGKFITLLIIYIIIYYGVRFIYTDIIPFVSKESQNYAIGWMYCAVYFRMYVCPYGADKC